MHSKCSQGYRRHPVMAHRSVEPQLGRMAKMFPIRHAGFASSLG